ncbi:MAG: hypothetical protein JSV56_01160, partial [Methanomassiliicoccales archaeon]
MNLAMQHGNQEITPFHLVYSIISDGENIVPQTIKKMGLNLNQLLSQLETEIQQFPKVEGGEQYIGQDFRRVLNTAQTVTNDFKDDYISTEHLFIAILNLKDRTSKFLNKNSIARENFLNALMEIRGS